MSIELPKALVQFASSNSSTAEPAGVCGVAPRFRKNRSCGGEILFQSGESVTISRRRRVLRNFESARDLSESEFAPNLHYQHLTLFVRQKIERGHERALRFIFNLKFWLNCLIDIGHRRGFAASAPAVAPEEIEGDGANGC